MGPWQQREVNMALERQAREREFPVIPVLLPGADPILGFVSQNTWIDLRAKGSFAPYAAIDYWRADSPSYKGGGLRQVRRSRGECGTRPVHSQKRSAPRAPFAMRGYVPAFGSVSDHRDDAPSRAPSRNPIRERQSEYRDISPTCHRQKAPSVPPYTQAA